ncbi:MAG: hypothetical protein A2663_01680 [Candidatus Buchananbacteria bacterium RIFCSPHIGHO2_01_FULL_46_12]|uniref:GerMN domain-containing protein n=1 Tax=Candidatus Buchananbacteria bacterium RIFCSPHIGHO2_01_FULL_46_12 TaxID=1797536 RepID=A0A1G1Y7W7_9BACT|nr:MAG: hypothetical protein A2663_01680 [Candidatus Buchananbacteria bacterium RIFCSPHIGHO2_01_FULL_46_12]
MKKILTLAFVTSLILTGCAKSTPTDTNQPAANANTGLANPASVFCQDHGGRLKIKTEESGLPRRSADLSAETQIVKAEGAEAGQFGLCIFNDDTRCEEWAYFRGDCQPGKNIIVFNPRKDEEITLPFTIKGQARVFENTLNYRLKDSAGKILATGIINAQSPDMGQFGDFSLGISDLYQKPTDNNVILEVFDYSAKDGSVIDLNTIPLKLTLPETTTLKIFFNNDKLDPEISCIKVFPVTRIIAKTPTVGQAALELLLTGTSPEEYESGYRTSLNSGVKLNSLKIENGIATADFNETLQFQVGGSCRVGAISAQIRETLKQFPTVKDVVISIDGRSEDVLQP